MSLRATLENIKTRAADGRFTSQEVKKTVAEIRRLTPAARPQALAALAADQDVMSADGRLLLARTFPDVFPKPRPAVPARRNSRGIGVAVVNRADSSIAISSEQAREIGTRIWQNECGRTEKGLVHWNVGEGFASVGIGHFLWYPAGRKRTFGEEFPAVVDFLMAHGAKLPPWLAQRWQQGERTCPWADLQSFVKADRANDPRLMELRHFLKDHTDLQAQFMALRVVKALPRMLASVPAERREGVAIQFHRVASEARGLYALMDYVNFKGEGANGSSGSDGRSWGLLQVLEGMHGTELGQAALDEFADSAARVLRRRVEKSRPERLESRWLAGWLKRVETYRGRTASGLA